MGQTRLCRADDGLGFDDRKGQAMSATIAQIDLDKLRNIVQKFDAYSFTAALVASEYGHGEAAPEEVVAQFEELLQRHAPVLGIQALAVPISGTATVWRAV